MKISLFFFYELCPFRTLAITTLHNFLSFVNLTKFHLFVISPKHCFAINLLKLVRQIRHCFPSICPVSIKFSEPSFLIICPRSFNCSFLMLSVSVLFVSLFDVKCKCSFVSPLLTCSVRGILSILLQNHVSSLFAIISKAITNLFLSAHLFMS